MMKKVRRKQGPDTVPIESMEMVDVEMIVANMAQVEQRINEAMPDSPESSGAATIYRGLDGSYLLTLEELTATNGADLHVILSSHESPESRNDVHAPGFLDFGKLKGNKCNHNFEIPDGVEIAAIRSVIINCNPFNMVFSVVELMDITTS